MHNTAHAFCSVQRLYLGAVAYVTVILEVRQSISITIDLFQTDS